MPYGNKQYRNDMVMGGLRQAEQVQTCHDMQDSTEPSTDMNCYAEQYNVSTYIMCYAEQ